MNKTTHKTAKEARNLALKAFGKPDSRTWKFRDGEVGEMTTQERDYLLAYKNDKDRKRREEVVRTIGEGKINPKTGRKMYPIPLAVIAGAAIVGGAAKAISGAKKRKDQRAAMRAEKQQIKEQIRNVKADFTKAKTIAGQEVQSRAQMDAIKERGAFDSFVAEASKSIVPEGAFIKKQKGLQTGQGAMMEESITSALDSSAMQQANISVAQRTQQDAETARTMDELQTTADRTIESLRRGKQAIDRNIQNTRGLTNVFTDVLGGASQGVSMVSNVYGTGGTV